MEYWPEGYTLPEAIEKALIYLERYDFDAARAIRIEYCGKGSRVEKAEAINISLANYNKKQGEGKRMILIYFAALHSVKAEKRVLN